jgi:hypothetical protein
VVDPTPRVDPINRMNPLYANQAEQTHQIDESPLAISVNLVLP